MLLLDISCPLGDSQAPVHVAPDPRPQHAQGTIQAPTYDRACAALVTRLDHTLGLECAYERVSLHLPSLPLSLIAPSLPHPSRRPLLSSFSISALIRSCFPPPSPCGPVPPFLASPLHNCAPVPIDRGLVLQTQMEIGFTAGECDAKPALYMPALCARSPLFPPLSHLPHLVLSSRSSRPIHLSPPSIALLAFVPVSRRPHPTPASTPSPPLPPLALLGTSSIYPHTCP
ncbi:hypothetical protein B0H14DRAFT_3491269 [Mycena olivaceomarginata]|nr:hypothetical protein B0H14DRAFT_3491269 [Mycena olivaceomarginata]